MTSSRSTPATGVSCAELALPCALIGLFLGLGVLSTLEFTYHPYDGIIGPPAYLGFSVGKRYAAYCLLLGLPVLGSLVGILLGKSADIQQWLAASFAAKTTLRILGGVLTMGAVMAGLPDGGIFGLDALAWFQLLLLAGVLAWLAQSRIPEPVETPPDGPALLAFAGRSATLAAVVWVLLQPALDSIGAALAISIPTGVLHTLLTRGKNPPQTGRCSMAEAAAWILVMAGLLFSPAARVAKALNLAWGAPVWIETVVLGATAVFIITGWLRFRAGERTLVAPTTALPIAAAALFAGAGGTLNRYDPFHQGEYIHAAQAMAQGALPFRDVFFVHGFGFNFLPGWIVGETLERVPSLDVLVLAGLSALAVALWTQTLLRTWGRAWTFSALLVALASASPFVDKGCRYMAVYAVIALMMAWLKSGRTQWLAVAGASGVAGVLFSLDTGLVALLAGMAWCALWGFRRVNQSSDSPLFNPRPLAAFIAGGMLASLPAFGWFAAMGVLDDFFATNIEYAAFKMHYDVLEIRQGGLLYLASPAATVLGLLTLLVQHASTSRPRRESSRGRMLRGLVLLLVLANGLMYTRGLDRSDFGHWIYASALAWPLLATLVVWKSEGAPLSAQLRRSLVTGGLLVSAQWWHPLVAGNPAPITPPQKFLLAYPVNSRLTAASGIEDLIRRDPFFRLCVDLAKTTRPGDLCLDMTGQPAIYRWTRMVCPTRYFALRYISGITRQREVVDRLETTQTRWILYPAQGHGGGRLDYVDIRLRNWLLCEYVFQNYRRVRDLEGGIVLMERSETGGPMIPPEQARKVALGEIPWLWGSHDQGVPAPPVSELSASDWIDASGQGVSLAGMPLDSTELWIEFAHGWEGGCVARMGADITTARPSFQFKVHRDFTGPYRIRVSSILPIEGNLYLTFRSKTMKAPGASFPPFRISWRR